MSILTRVESPPTPTTSDIEIVEQDVPTAPARRGILWPLKWYLVSRLVVLAATIPALFMHDPGSGPWPIMPGNLALLRALGRWDGAWYLWVANNGYPTAGQFHHHLSEVAFFPLYPMTVRGLSGLTGWSELAAGVTVALIAGAVATVLVWKLAARLANHKVADRAVMLFVFFPGSFALSMAYAEGFMVVGVAACLLALLNRRWVLAGLAGAFATASRPNAAAIVIACAVAAAVEIYRRREWKALLAPAIASTGALAFFTFLWIRTGHALAWFESEKEEWHDHLGYGQGVWKRVTGLFHHFPTSFKPGSLNDVVAVGGVLIVLLSAVVLWRMRWPLFVRIYTAAALLIPVLSVAVGPRPRMLFGAFPMAVAVADKSSRTVYRVAVIASAVILVAITIVITTSLSSTP
ncbi:MAG TPA: hypothetical protein VFV00_07270 [Acidimicrobiales bacterium]|nr:hypothetical protein [Acidimicrobiales bacterium]